MDGNINNMNTNKYTFNISVNIKNNFGRKSLNVKWINQQKNN